MTTLVIGTDGPTFRRLPDGRIQEEAGGPAALRFLARTDRGLAAVTQAGTLWEQPQGSGWHLISERPVPDDIWSFAADPRSPGRLYLGVSPALLYISDDWGGSWRACDAIKRIPGYEGWTFPPPPHIPHVRSIAPDPVRVGAVYIGVEEGGAYYSDDDGAGWRSLNEGLYWDVHTVTPTSGDRLYATTGAGFHRSDDRGTRWRRIMDGIDRVYTVPLVSAPGRPDRIFSAAAATPPPGWKNGANAALYRSDDGGEHWTQLQNGLPDRFDVMVRQLVFDGERTLLTSSGSDIYGSGDEGEHWERLATDLPRIRALAAV